MSTIVGALHVAASTLTAYDQALVVTENNVANSSTPGYVQQTQTFYAMPFQDGHGSLGGVRAAEVVSARDQYAEQAVWQQNTALGQANQDVSGLTSLQNNFPISGDSGIAAALNSLYQSFSAWGQTPADNNARQDVLNQAGDVAEAFQHAATGLANLAQTTDQQVQQTVSQVNQLVGQLQSYNSQIMNGDRNDAGLDAQVYSTLEQLSQYVDISATKQANGSVTVMAAGQTPLLIGDTQFQLSCQIEQPTDPPPAYPTGPPSVQILSAQGNDITGTIATGQLGSLLNLTNQVLPSYIGNAYQQGSLNILAQQFADRVNGLLTSGNVTDAVAAGPNGTGGSPAVPGVPLFTYATNDDGTPNATNVAQSLAVNPGITASQLAAIDPGPPEVSNGIALALASMATPTDSADEIDGASYTQYYGNMASQVGSDLNTATDQQQVSQSALAQAQNLRQQQSGVNLDEEAVNLVAFQRAYEANSKLVSVLDQITLDTINMMTPSA
ncbi:MAG TPA: flagellar hook-associated protein FlgK [Bryobacteraceae bacterium]|nr:flagellar hook-associated protein FlgK [Bryobacteraceae bacterium]